MSIPPGEEEFPYIRCPNCGKEYKLTDLELADEEEMIYICPNCESDVYSPIEE